MPTTYAWTLDASPQESASAFLSRETGLSKGRIKDAMAKGAVWLKRPGQPRRRLRRATAELRACDELAMHYDPGLLSIEPPDPTLLEDLLRYSAWYKPSGLLTQGTSAGDHCSLLRRAELALGGNRRFHPVHRLDREVAGVALIAHEREAARRLTALLHDEDTRKTYVAEVLGDLRVRTPYGEIADPLEGRAARTGFEVLAIRPEQGATLVRIRLFTGRTHQIRRHFEGIGHPVLGDPRYGRGNKGTGGIRLAALSLELTCPFSGRRLQWRIPEALRPEWSINENCSGLKEE
jgi:tRNA pseudouridine32 synthase / 23S rRNA pseudouridine746 synthase